MKFNHRFYKEINLYSGAAFVAAKFLFWGDPTFGTWLSISVFAVGLMLMAISFVVLPTKK